MQKYDIAVIGGGASGLACAVRLKELDKNLSVVVIEKGERAGKKIAASGNGQGNVSNTDLGAEHYHGSGAHLAEKLCSSRLYNPLGIFDFLFVSDRLGRIYPAGKQGSALSDCLLRKVEASGAELRLSTAVTAVNKGFFLTLSDGGKIAADKVVLAAGGRAQKQFGTDGGGYKLAQGLGHSVTPLYPSLVQLKCDTRHIKTLKGIRTECRVTAVGKDGKILGSSTGDIIFTDYGVSGNAAFYVSAYCAGEDGVTLSLEFLPDVPEEKIAEDVANKLSKGYAQAELLCGTLHNQIGRAIMRRLESSDPRTVARAVKNFTLAAQGSLGFDYAQVTKGGVPAAEVDDDLQSRLVPNLYFTGELLDVDGDCGGYNLTWALVSGMHAAKCIVNSLNNDD
ncbi:MAG: aminoacetone oxidase family FAD-binding enzyme [Clostridiales bacterium]|nr:aminoacetone oxidase family FAD-binding enzyme [Clostridiales bacterium]